MTKKTRATAIRTRFRLMEEAERPRVDPYRAIVFGLKILGERSDNNRVYTPDCLRKAAPLYEGVGVNADHPDEPTDQRSVRDRIGVLKNVRFRNGSGGSGLYGDLHLIKSHPLSPAILEAAQNPILARSMGASHNADGDVDVVDGKTVVKEITEVRSVDIVNSPASTRGLFESIEASKAKLSKGKRRMAKITLKEHFARIPLLKPARAKIKSLFEAQVMDPDAMMEDDYLADEPVEEADGDVEGAPSMGGDPAGADVDPEQALRGGFNAAMHAVIDDQTLDIPSKLKRLKELMRAAESLLSSGEEIPEQEDEDEEAVVEGEDCDEEVMESEDGYDGVAGEGKPAVKKAKPDAAGKVSVKESKQSLAKKNAYLSAKLRAVEMCAERNVKPTPVLLEALARLPGDRARQALLEDQGRSDRRVRTTAAGGPGREDDDAKEFCRAIGAPVID